MHICNYITVYFFAVGNANPFRYRSYYFDEETGLYYLNSRYYDPETGRFVNADDISFLDPETINGLNLYAYCGDNPVMLTDPTGRKSYINFGIDVWSLINKSGQVWFSKNGTLKFGFSLGWGFEITIRLW